jgi:hypothetical protein
VTPNEFDSRVREAMAVKRAWFDGVEPPVSEEAVTKVESKIGCALPQEFMHFAVTFGGGYFGGVNISTLEETSDWYVLSRPPIKVDEKTMLVVSDDEAGGYYGFVLDHGSFQTGVTYINPDDGNYTEQAASSFFEFIDKFAINM